VKERVAASAVRLAGGPSPERRGQLAINPVAAIRDMGVMVAEMPPASTSEACSCDGAYFPATPATEALIGYAKTPGSRRENFTLLHELAHHLIRLDDHLLCEIADFDGDMDTLEERICDAFAGRVLVPDEVVTRVLGSRRPEAADLRALFQACNGSREACAVRLAERLPCDGYVALLDQTTRTVRFASASPGSEYAWGRGSPLPSGHVAWRAVAAGSYRGEGEVVWRSGQRKQFWLDAVCDGSTAVVAIFAANRYWTGSGLSILSDVSTTKATPTLFSGTCRHCGADTYGTRACEKCGDVKCRKCGKCGCGAPAPLVKTCTECHMQKGKALFPAGSSVCRECKDA
jgi:IrrE N-terminal-like domain